MSLGNDFWVTPKAALSLLLGESLNFEFLAIVVGEGSWIDGVVFVVLEFVGMLSYFFLIFRVGVLFPESTSLILFRFENEGRTNESFLELSPSTPGLLPSSMDYRVSL